MFRPPEKQLRLSPLSEFLNPGLARNSGLLVVLAIFSLSLLFLFSYRNLSREFSGLEDRGISLARELNDLESIRISVLRRRLLDERGSKPFPSRHSVVRGLAVQSMASLADLQSLPHGQKEKKILEDLSGRLHRESREIPLPGTGHFPTELALNDDDNSILSDVSRMHRRISALRQEIGLLQHEVLHRKERLLTFSLLILTLGSVITLALLVINFVIRQDRRELGRREDLLKGLLSSTSNGVILKDREGRWIDFSPRVSELLDISEIPGDILGKTDQEIATLYPHTGTFFSESLLIDPLILARKQSFQSAESISHQDSWPRHLLVERSPLYSGGDEVLGTITTLIDITERTALEDLQKSSARIASIGLEVQDPSEFLSRACQIIADHSKFLLVWTTRLSGDTGTGGKNLLLENFHSRSARFITPGSLPLVLTEKESDLLLDNGRSIDSWVIGHRHFHLESSVRLSFPSRLFPFYTPAGEKEQDPLDFTAIVFPLFQGGEVFGTLGILSSGHGSLSAQMEGLLARLSGTLSLVLESLHSGSERRRAEDRSLLLKNFYEALSKVAARLLSLPAPEILLGSVCQILYETGNASTCWIRMENPESGEISLPFHAGRLDEADMTLLTQMANEPDTLASRGFSREALRTGRPNVQNDLSKVTGSWKPARFLIDRGIFSLCALPLSENGIMKHSLVVAGDTPDFFTPELIALLSHFADNISFGVDNFRREFQRRHNTEKTERLKNIYQALSDANEILLTHPHPDKVFEQLCQTIVLHSHAHTAGLYLLDRKSLTGTLSAWIGPAPEDLSILAPSADRALPEGQGVFGEVVRNESSRILNLDGIPFLPTPAIRILFEELGVRSIGGFPIRRGKEIFGVLLLTSTEPFFFDEELRGLIDRMVLNISFALDHFDREEVRKEREHTILYQSLHDMLTGLPNRILFSQKIDEAIGQTTPFAVGIIDLDNFKEINDRLGHKVGDMLLGEVASRLKEHLRPSDALARLGGDEFGILLQGIGTCPEIQGERSDPEFVLSSLLQEMIKSLEQPIIVGEETIQGVSMSIGIALFPDQGETAEVLLKRSDLALYESKSRRGGVWTLFSGDLEMRLERTFMIRSEFGKAFGTEDLLLHVQPQISFESGNPTGVEALVRWNHPQKGLLLPGAFIQEVENSPSLIRKLGLSMLDKALDHVALWKKEGIFMPVAVNIGARHFLDPHFTEDVSRILANHPTVSPSALQIEITESTTLSDFKTVQSILKHLRTMGVEIALDDFGTGHASLSYLQKIPADAIKMDIQFVRDILVDSKDLAIVAGTLTTARLLKLKTVAEGVETPEHGVVLMKLGCRSGQGYGIARPMPAEDFPRWIRNFSPDPLLAEWFDRPWSRRNILHLAIYMDHHRRSGDLYARIRASAAEVRRSFPLQECPLSAWINGKGSHLFGQSPLYRELVDLHHKAHTLSKEMEAFLRNRRFEEASRLIAEHRQLNNRILWALEDLGPDDPS